MLKTLKDLFDTLLAPQPAAAGAGSAGSEHRLQLATLMWRVAYADGHLAEHERHTIWRVADLLHVPQVACVLARQRAQEDRS